MSDQLTLPHFSGETYDHERDGARLNKHLHKVYDLVRDRRWYTLKEIAEEVGCTEASASARLRDLRKKQFGGHIVEREYVSDGLWRYRLVL